VYWEMESGEQPVWFGWPEARPYVRATTRWGRVLLGVPYAAVGSVLVPIAISVGALFVAVGVGMLGEPLWNYLKARNTIYIVTNRRLIVIEHVLRQSVKSFSGDVIKKVERREDHCGVGSVIFARIEARVRREDGFNHSMVEEKGFIGIRNVGEVWRLVMNLKNQLV